MRLGPTVLGLGAALLLGVPVAQAAPEPSPVIDADVRPTVAVVGRDGVPAHVLEAVAFELDQAGFVVASPTARVGATIHVGGVDEAWRIEVDNHVRGVEVRGNAGTESAALLAVELLLASDVKAVAKPEPEPRPEPRDPVPTELEATTEIGALRTSAPMAPPRELPWSLGVGLAAANIGPIGVGVDLHHDWNRATLGVGLEGGLLTGYSEEIDLGVTRGIAGGGFARARVGAAFVSRPGRGVRPTIGASTALMAPFLRSRYAGPDPRDPGTHLDANGTTAGLLFVPSADVGLRIALRSKASLALGVRVGPRIDLVALRLVDGTVFATAPWFGAATVAMRFGLG